MAGVWAKLPNSLLVPSVKEAQRGGLGGHQEETLAPGQPLHSCHRALHHHPAVSPGPRKGGGEYKDDYQSATLKC